MCEVIAKKQISPSSDGNNNTRRKCGAVRVVLSAGGRCERLQPLSACHFTPTEGSTLCLLGAKRPMDRPFNSNHWLLGLCSETNRGTFALHRVSLHELPCDGGILF